MLSRPLDSPLERDDQVTKWGDVHEMIPTVRGRVSYERWCGREAIRMLDARVEFEALGETMFCAVIRRGAERCFRAHDKFKVHLHQRAPKKPVAARKVIVLEDVPDDPPVPLPMTQGRERSIEQSRQIHAEVSRLFRAAKVRKR